MIEKGPPDGFEGVEIPDRLPDDVAPPVQFFGLRPEEMRANGYLYFLVLKAALQPPEGAARTVGGVYKICWASSRTIQTIAATDAKRAQGVVLGLIRHLEGRGILRCSPPLAAETVASPVISLTTVEPAGDLLQPAVARFLLDHAYGAALWLARGIELSHALEMRVFPRG